MPELLFSNDPVNKRLLKLYEVYDKKAKYSLQSAERQIARSYLESVKTMKTELERMYTKFADDAGIIPKTQAYKYNRLQNLSEQMELEARKLNKTVGGKISSEIKSQYKGSYYSTGYINESTFKAGMGFTTLNAEAVNAAALNPLGLIKWPASQSQAIGAMVQGTRSVLTQGIAQGWSYTKTARELKDAVNISFSKSVCIVRTEAHRSRELGALDGFNKAEAAGEKLGIELEKVWAHGSGGSDPRDAHISMNGQVADKDGNFHSPTGNSGPAPGNLGSAEDDINCTCFVIEQVKDHPMIEPGPNESMKDWSKRKKIKTDVKNLIPKSTPKDVTKMTKRQLKKITIDDTSDLLKNKGFKIGRGSIDLNTMKTYYNVTTPSGKIVKMSASAIKGLL